jgi:hypothetical protein
VLKRGRNERNEFFSQAWWLMPVILATSKAKIRSIVVGGQPRQKVCENPYQTIGRCGGTCLQICRKLK